MNNLLKEMGVVGAGGAGFPTYVKAGSQVEYIIANGAECEPLVHKDVPLMEHFAPQIVSGMRRMMGFTGATKGVFGIKKKNAGAIAALAPHLEAAGIEPLLMGDFYPAGDEYELVYMATGRLIPPAGIPLQVGCVVNNVETLYNVERAANGHPVVDKFVSVTGLVAEPRSFWVPIGTTYRELLARAGGATVNDYAMLTSGILMGGISFDPETVVTKTFGGLIILPADHPLVRRKTTPNEAQRRIGRSACDQCSYCTEMCPRYLLGYDVQPHKVMRTLGFSKAGAELLNQWAQLCCSCGLCTLYACPEDLYPREACEDAKADLREAGIKFTQTKPLKVHPMKEARRVPSSMVRQRLKLDEYDSHAPYDDRWEEPPEVRLMLSQHVGKPATPAVKAGDRIERGQVIARSDADSLGVNIHASVSGTVTAVESTFVHIIR